MSILGAPVSPWPFVVAIVLVVALWCIATWFGFRSLKRKRLIENVPTSKVNGVFLGLNEVKGRVRCEIPLVSYLAETACVHFAYDIQEHWRKTESYTDSKGKRRTRTRSGWTSVDSGGALIPFDLQDDTGRILVEPEGAEIQPLTVFSETCGRGDPLYHGKGPDGSVSHSTHRRRFTERALPLGEDLYVLGPAQMRRSIAAPKIAHDPDGEIYLISTRDERQLTRSYGWKAFGLLLFGALLAFVFPIALALPETGDLQQAFELRLPWALGAVGIHLGAVLVFYLVQVYNGLVSVRERSEMAWSMVEVQLKRRHDLIPRLVACVKGAATHERETHERLAALRVDGLRGGGSVEEAAGVAARQGQAARTILALAEAYPDLRSDASFARLQEELIDTEDRIALAREFMNSSVNAYNTRLQTLPDLLIARLGRFREQPLFDYDGPAQAPAVDL